MFHLTALRGQADVLLKLSYSHELENTIQIVGATGDINLRVDAVGSANWRQYNPPLQGELTAPETESITDVIDAFAEEISSFTDVIRGPQSAGRRETEPRTPRR